MTLVRDLRADGRPLSLRAAEEIERLHRQRVSAIQRAKGEQKRAERLQAELRERRA